MTFLQKAIVYGTGVRQLNGPLYYTGTQSFISKTSLWLDQKLWVSLLNFDKLCSFQTFQPVIVTSEGVILFMIIENVHQLIVIGLKLLRIF